MNTRALTRSGSAWRAGTALAVGCLVAKSARAVDTAPPSIWYRSSEGCPDGAAFVARLHGAAEGAKLATAGDRIDFVVTLGLKEGHAFGQLERQTAEGRVAVRELVASRCDEVADAVALTLTLALEPRATPAGASRQTTTPATAAAAEATKPAPTSAVATAAAPTPNLPAASVALPAPVARAATAQGGGERSGRWRAGADATLYKGSLPDPLLGARIFVELGGNAPWHGSSARVGAFFAKRAGETDPDVSVVLAGGRLDACPVPLFGPSVELRPCLALELGWEQARGTSSNGVSDGAFWASGSASARLVWHASRLVALEAELGPSVPFTRYELVEKESGSVIHQTENIGFSAALGVFVELP